MIESDRVCYIINFYLGDRRRCINEFYGKKSIFLEKHIELLETIPHNLSKIVLNFNLDVTHYEEFNNCLKLIPKRIKQSDVEIFVRENKGFSYGAFSDNFLRLRNNYDYFIFNEDDYFPIEDNWDAYLVNKYNSLPNSGYLCNIIREPAEWNNFRRFAGNCFGIASTKNLDKIVEKYGNLPNSISNDYYNQEEIQIIFGNSFEEVGLKLYDIREEFKSAHAMTEQNDPDVHLQFTWNKNFLILPAVMMFKSSHSYWESFDDEFTRRYNLI